MINFDDYVSENITEHNKNWPYTLDHPYTILMIGSSGSGNRNALLNLIENQPDIDKIYLHAKDPYEAKYQYLINICEKVAINHLTTLKLLLSIQMICKMFTKTLMNTIQIKNVKY